MGEVKHTPGALEALKADEKVLFQAWLSAPEGAPTRTAERKLKTVRAALARAQAS